ncbi:hypothetical protein [Clostridium estertheticum]|uniref:hypothetical protein n=1 Tax=Clostridium estertheticum TaxID=238834 RepID=UPI001CF314B0|nr:hypothetical protein [Clostridium estertheticum]MCB2354460.1 hypothetical protein [Clostridium estertheticum]WAG42427.1 hypothetical protein LL065_07045 [Clostridium estertheticum]
MILVLKEFDGIIGAIAGGVIGTVSTLIATQLLKRMGKLNLFIKKWEIRRPQLDGYGGTSMVNATSCNEAYYHITFNMETYNGSEIPKIMRDVKIAFYKDKKELFKIVPCDRDNDKVIAGGFRDSQEVNVLNFEPKKCTTKDFSFRIDDIDMLDNLKEVNKIYFIHTNENKKVKKLFIRKQVI